MNEEQHKQFINTAYGLYKIDKKLELQQEKIENMRSWLKDWMIEKERIDRVKKKNSRFKKH